MSLCLQAILTAARVKTWLMLGGRVVWLWFETRGPLALPLLRICLPDSISTSVLPAETRFNLDECLTAGPIPVWTYCAQALLDHHLQRVLDGAKARIHFEVTELLQGRY